MQKIRCTVILIDGFLVFTVFAVVDYCSVLKKNSSLARVILELFPSFVISFLKYVKPYVFEFDTVYDHISVQLLSVAN